MKDFIFKVIGFVPHFISDLANLVSNPRKFLPGSLVREEALKNALLFTFMCFSFQVMLDWMTYNVIVDDVWEHVIRGSFKELLAISFVAVSIVLAWRMVGGNTKYTNVLIYLCYIQGVFFIISGFENTLNIGLLRFFAPDLTMMANPEITGKALKELLDVTRSELYLEQIGNYTIAATIISLFFFPITFFWLLFAWLSYKDLLQASWLRAIMFAVPFVVLVIGFSLLNNFLSYSFSKDPINLQQITEILQGYDSTAAVVQDTTTTKQPKEQAAIINKSAIGGTEPPAKVNEPKKAVAAPEVISPLGVWINREGEYWNFYTNGTFTIATLEGYILNGYYDLEGTTLTGDIIISPEYAELNGTFTFTYNKPAKAFTGNVYWANYTLPQTLSRE